MGQEGAGASGTGWADMELRQAVCRMVLPWFKGGLREKSNLALPWQLPRAAGMLWGKVVLTP